MTDERMNHLKLALASGQCPETIEFFESSNRQSGKGKKDTRKKIYFL